ncbi:hypothetical protein M427DRAFT_30655 [Gonapodya prolifera JEL478]|uniref:Uncharacterized protein n=1 Tax=Gonapodya prolifera (strain JEL478) TaxID=1344416 RepID=A0A139AK85_GONPJ|nr:hypothetical protein M427DRAFT_30655 [Gonapodya prolifera JEL478]|eukprot:KXS17191.1 hypothetical protein M427DRAFT_30655 [Gonapodya prolifera JEL478]
MIVEEQLASALGEPPSSFGSLDTVRGRLRDDAKTRFSCLEAAIQAIPVPVEMIHFLTETAADGCQPIVAISLMVFWALERGGTEALHCIIMQDETLVTRLADDVKFSRGKMLFKAVEFKSLITVTNVVTKYLPRLQAVSEEELSSSDFAAGVERALWLPDPVIFEWLVTEKSVIWSHQILGAALDDVLKDDSTWESVNIHHVRRVLSMIKDDIPEGFGTLSAVAVSRIALPADDELDEVVLSTLQDRFHHGPRGILLAAKDIRRSQKLSILSKFGADGTTADQKQSSDSDSKGTDEEPDRDSMVTDEETTSDSTGTDEKAEEDYVTSGAKPLTDELVRFFKRWVPTLATVDDASKVLSTGAYTPANRERILSAAFAQRNLRVIRYLHGLRSVDLPLRALKHLRETGDVHFVDRLAVAFPDDFAQCVSTERRDFLLHAVRANDVKLVDHVLDVMFRQIGAPLEVSTDWAGNPVLNAPVGYNRRHYAPTEQETVSALKDSLDSHSNAMLAHLVNVHGFKPTEDVFRYMDRLIDSVAERPRGASFCRNCRKAFVGIEFSAGFDGLAVSSLAKIIFPANDDLDMKVISKANELRAGPAAIDMALKRATSEQNVYASRMLLSEMKK